MGQTILSITDGLATPSALLNSKFQTVNTAPTTITDFLNGQLGQVIVIVFTDANTTVAHGVNIFLSSGGNKTYAINQSLMLMKIGGGGEWIQIGGEI